ncbi:MAG: DUF4040 domain-containing protein [Halanaerobiales bacterium]|nr:DUF4040 domain-containing protein [Halanaerobiales bacterium]
MMILSYLLILLMIIGALAAVLFENLLNSIISLGLISLIAAALMYILKAPDVAMTEAIIGAGLTTSIFIFTLIKINRGDSQ